MAVTKSLWSTLAFLLSRHDARAIDVVNLGTVRTGILECMDAVAWGLPRCDDVPIVCTEEKHDPCNFMSVECTSKFIFAKSTGAC
jgi:hypothetical protein